MTAPTRTLPAAEVARLLAERARHASDTMRFLRTQYNAGNTADYAYQRGRLETCEHIAAHLEFRALIAGEGKL